jgi:hypothetical protein
VADGAGWQICRLAHRCSFNPTKKIARRARFFLD